MCLALSTSSSALRARRGTVGSIPQLPSGESANHHHDRLMGEVPARISDRRVLGLILEPPRAATRSSNARSWSSEPHIFGAVPPYIEHDSPASDWPALAAMEILSARRPAAGWAA